MVALQENLGITKLSRINPLGTLNVHTKFDANPLSRC